MHALFFASNLLILYNKLTSFAYHNDDNNEKNAFLTVSFNILVRSRVIKSIDERMTCF